MPFDAATLQHVEDALSEVFNYHNALDTFILRCGYSRSRLTESRNKAESRAAGGRFEKASKRLVVQEVLQDLGTVSSDSDHIVAAEFVTQLCKGSFPEATPRALEAIDALKAQTAANQRTKVEERAEREREAANAKRAIERQNEAKRANRTKEREALRDRFVGLMSETNVQGRGFLLETFLNDMFEFEGLARISQRAMG